VGALKDPKPLSTELEHLGHEGHTFELARLVQHGEDLPFTADLDQLTRSKL
jgi:hypothetical protein